MIQFVGQAQNDSIPGVKIDGVIEFSSATVKKGENVNFAFFTEFNKQVVLELYSEKGELLSTTNIEVYSDKGLALATRSFEPGMYYLRLILKTKSMVKRLVVEE